jgi:aldose 1-epimerase
MVKKWLSSVYHTVWRRNLMRSGMVTGLLLAAVLVGLTVAYRAHVQGNFHKLKLKANIDSEVQDAPVPKPGGQDAITLMRTRLMGSSAPEFLTVTLLPGRGMNVFQITAFIPGKGEVNLLASPSLESAASAMTGKGADAQGRASMAMGGAFEVPWAGSLWGAPAEGGGHVTAVWQGHAINLPADGREAQNGLILAEAADPASSETLPDGGNGVADFHAGDFGGHWLSKTDVEVRVLLSRQSIELTVMANNVGDVAEPIGIGWHPRLAIFDGDRGQWRLHIPAERRVEVREKEKGAPTGELVPVAGTHYDFQAIDGVRLGTMTLDECFTGLKQKLLDNGPTTELSNPAGGFGLRLTALSPTIRVMRVVAPADGSYVSIDPQYNYPDAFGREWERQPSTGIVVLQPGESTEWKVKLELVSLGGGAPSL